MTENFILDRYGRFYIIITLKFTHSLQHKCLSILFNHNEIGQRQLMGGRGDVPLPGKLGGRDVPPPLEK